MPRGGVRACTRTLVNQGGVGIRMPDRRPVGRSSHSQGVPKVKVHDTMICTVCNQEAGHPGKLATDFLQLLVLHEISKKLYHWKA